MPAPPSATRTYQVDGPRPPDDVWDRYVRPSRWPEWSPQIRAVRYGHDRLAPATSGRVVGPGGLPVPFDVLDVEDADPRGRSWTWVARLGPVRLRMRHDVRPRPGGGTVTGWHVQGPWPVVVAYAPLALVALRRLVR